MPLALQAKLLRVLQEGTVERLGSNRSVQLDVRVIAACNRDPRIAVRDGCLREDLYYRLNVFGLALPPLRERPDDLPGLVQQLAQRQGRQVQLSPAALACLRAYAWPGNVRELDNVIQRALILCSGAQIDTPHLPADLRQGAGTTADRPASALAPVPTPEAPPTPQTLCLPEAVEQLEQQLIGLALAQTGDNKRRAAALLGISERTLWYKLGRSKSEGPTEMDGAAQ
jgi:two-component system response regulator AtoC